MKSTLQEVFHKLFLHHNSHRKIHSNSNNNCLSSNSIQIIWISILESKNFHNKDNRINSHLTTLTPTITSILKCNSHYILSSNSHSSHSNNNNSNLLQISSTKVLDSQVTSIHSKLPRISSNILTLDIQIMVRLHTPIYLLFNNNSISLQCNYLLSTSHRNSNNPNNPNNNQLKDSNSSSLHSNHKSKCPITTTTNKQLIA